MLMDEITVRVPMFYWQSLRPSGPNEVFYRFCDALEVNNGVSAPAKGWGLEHALAAWGNYTSGFLSPIRERLDNLD